MPKTKTATIERYHCYGTPRYHIRVTYCGRTINWAEGNSTVYADWVDGSQDADIANARAVAKRFGFTHVRFVGDWERRTKPQGGKV